MDYIQEYIAVLKHRISDLEVQLAVVRSMLPNCPPPGNVPPPPTVKPKHLNLVKDHATDLAKDLTLKP